MTKEPTTIDVPSGVFIVRTNSKGETRLLPVEGTYADAKARGDAKIRAGAWLRYRIHTLPAGRTTLTIG